MCNIVILVVHLMVTVVRLARPGGLRSVVAESVLLKHQLCILNRGRKRAPNLHAARGCASSKLRAAFEINNLKKRDVTMLHAIWLGEIAIRHERAMID
jgi:hypothetical protein